MAEAIRRLETSGLLSLVGGLELVESVRITVGVEPGARAREEIAQALGGIRHTIEIQPPESGVLHQRPAPGPAG